MMLKSFNAKVAVTGKLLMVAALFALVLTSCEENADLKPNTTDNINEGVVRQFTDLNGGLQRMRTRGLNSGQAFFNGRATARNKFANARTENDSTVCDGGFHWETCAQVTETENQDGSVTVVTDYGEEGCEEFGILIKGKITETFKSENNKETVKTVYENYSFEDITINGTSSATYSWSWDEQDSLSYSFASTWEEDLTIKDEDGETYTIKSSMSDSGDENGWTLEGSSTYTSSNGDVFESEIKVPLFYDFKCEDAFVPVKGVESCKFNDDVFEINYGDGACDNIITVTENGETYTIDLEEEYEEEEENSNS
ncbi:hypothetical protein QQ008_01045 [Fulvivirgaceae bacterium BMA10]|uniref:Lipoprotein n=1 Tax=Splendidivirga corallicola TaxID=3051826 RepID=A0ABT8KGS5_9BACT|nr:hypothetical protein [Fulvivirgaceae bacterium BMA10]